MAYKVVIDSKKKLVEIYFEGQSRAREQFAAREEAISLCVNNQLNRVLADLRCTQIDMSKDELYEFGNSWPTSKLPDSFRLVALAQENDATPSYLMALAQLEGISAKLFYDEKAARNWLVS